LVRFTDGQRSGDPLQLSELSSRALATPDARSAAAEQSPPGWIVDEVGGSRPLSSKYLASDSYW